MYFSNFLFWTSGLEYGFHGRNDLDELRKSSSLELEKFQTVVKYSGFWSSNVADSWPCSDYGRRVCKSLEKGLETPSSGVLFDGLCAKHKCFGGLSICYH